MTKHQDLPYFYTERTDIGLLSVAAHEMGAVSIEEYSADKGKGAKKYTGRADLWICLKDGTTFDFEAKQQWISLNSKRIAKLIKPVLRGAAYATKELTYKSDWSIGIVFVTPYVRTLSRKIESVPFKKQILAFKKQILDNDSYDGDFVAVHFCDEQIWKTARIDKEFFYPGIATVGKIIKRP